jgi:hypothetical protein
VARQTVGEKTLLHADHIYRTLTVLLTFRLIAQPISKPEDRVLSVERNVLITRLHSHHTPRKIERQLALRCSSLKAKRNIQESVRAGTIVGHQSRSLLSNLGDSCRAVELDVYNRRHGGEDRGLARFFSGVVLERSGVVVGFETAWARLVGGLQAQESEVCFFHRLDDVHSAGGE